MGFGSGPLIASEHSRSSSTTTARIIKALERSSDEGDTLDLSRRGIEKIQEEDVEMFRSGVGKDKKGVWR